MKRACRYVLGAVGIVSFIFSCFSVQFIQFNVANYTTLKSANNYWPAQLFAWSLCILSVGIVLRGKHSWWDGLANCWPFVVGLPVAVLARIHNEPPFWIGFLLVLTAGVAVLTKVRGELRVPRESNAAKMSCITTLLVTIVFLAAIHTYLQWEFYQHFQLGHADFGHYLEELKNCVAGRGLRSDSFSNTRLGWHFGPLLYALVPFYVVWPSPLLLMVLGPIFLHAPSLAIFTVVKRRSGSAWTALLMAIAWLALPSVGRMVYSNTYGFQWDYAGLCLLAFALCCFLLNRWVWATVLLVLVALCVETALPAVMGVGLIVAWELRRRMRGALIIGVAAIYLWTCISWIIPSFAASGSYDRADLFGALGSGLAEVLMFPIFKFELFFERLLRPQCIYLLAMLMVPMCLLPLLSWRWVMAASLVLVPICLLQNPAWLSIKFWHQGTVLVLLFFGVVVLIKPAEISGTDGDAGLVALKSGLHPRGIALAVFVSALWSHYLFGVSPVSKSFEAVVADGVLTNPDPRLQTIQLLRESILRDHTILATERLAAHFWDYKRIYTGRRVKPADYVVIDRSDTWDQSGLRDRTQEYVLNAEYQKVGEFGPIVIFRSRIPAEHEK